MTVQTCCLPSRRLILIATALQAIICVANGRNEIFVVPRRTLAACLWRHLALARARVAPHKLLTERGVAETGGRARAARHGNGIFPTCHTHPPFFIRARRTRVAHQGVCHQTGITVTSVTNARLKAKLALETLRRTVLRTRLAAVWNLSLIHI